MARQKPQPRDARLSLAEMEAARQKIDRRLDELRAFDVDSIQDCYNPKIKALETALDNTLARIFGRDTNEFMRYIRIINLDRASYSIGSAATLREIHEGLQRGVSEAVSVLETIKQGFEEELVDAGRGKAAHPLKAYEGLELDPAIAQHVGSLCRSGHYSEAVEKAVKVLNDLVRDKSGLELDGSPLMQKAFSPKDPVLSFNTLSDQSERDEQQGFMYLFAGAVMGIRNPRAHKIIEDDPQQALEFIALISLLVKMLNQSKLVE